MVMHEKILEVLRRGGPQVAPKVAREVKGEAIIISAYLSELKAAGKLKISQMKIGTSPLYYLPGQEKQLALFADRLNPKDRAVFDKLEQLKVLREAQLDLLSKVALRKMKDFAIPLQVSVGGKNEIFWRWYMLKPEETNLIVSSLLQQVGRQEMMQEVRPEQLSTPVDPRIAPQVKTTAVSTRPATDVAKSTVAAVKVAAPAASTVQEKPSDLKNPWGGEYPPNTTVKGEAKVDSVYPVNTAAQGPIGFEDTMQAHVVEVVNTADIDAVRPAEVDIPEEENVEDVEEELEVPEVEVQQTITEVEEEPVTVEVERVEVIKTTPKNTAKKEKTATEEKKETKAQPAEKQKSLVEKLKDTFMPKHKGKAGELLPQVEAFFTEKKITIESSEVVRKNADLSLQVLVPSAVGDVLFFCKVRRKKRCDEKDISAAYMEAQVAKLPLLFLYTDDVSAKAKEFLDSGSFDNLLLMKLESPQKE